MIRYFEISSLPTRYRLSTGHFIHSIFVVFILRTIFAGTKSCIILPSCSDVFQMGHFHIIHDYIGANLRANRPVCHISSWIICTHFNWHLGRITSKFWICWVPQIQVTFTTFDLQMIDLQVCNEICSFFPRQISQQLVLFVGCDFMWIEYCCIGYFPRKIIEPSA